MNVVSPISFALATAVAFSAGSALIPLLGPGIFGFLYRSFMCAIRVLPARQKTWGTVYDAVTKRPIPFTRVQLLDANHRVLETSIADANGRYGFLTNTENLMTHRIAVTIVPIQKGYVFPAVSLPSVDHLMYRNMYYGGIIQAGNSQVINVDIPMDPIKPVHSSIFAHVPSVALGVAVVAMADAAFWLGLIVVPANFIMNPDPFTFGTLCLFLGVASLRIFGITLQPFGVVIDVQTGQALPFTLMTLQDVNGKRIGYTVSDELGRYILPTDSGHFNVELHTSALVMPPRHTTIALETKKGWITQKFAL